MQLTRTTLRLDKNLKKDVEKLALEEETSVQKIMNDALSDFLKKAAKKKAGIRFIPTHNLGVPLDNLTRNDYYDRLKF